MNIRKATAADFEAIWQIFHPIVAAGTTYTIDPDTDRVGAQKIWMELPQETWVVEDEGAVLGTYYIKPNQGGGGRHVCNCGYMVSEAARGKGLARAMCVHSQERAKVLGFRAMQFNFVVATNVGAIGLWRKLGFEEVGRLPGAFNHPEQGYVDALVMFKAL